MLNEETKKVTKLQLTITLIIILLISITGTTYAYFTISGTNNTITGNMATVNLTLDISRIFPIENSDNTGVIVPQLSTSGSATSPLASALKNACIDANKNIVCQVYKINIQNVGGTATQVVNGNIYFYSDSSLTRDASIEIPNLKWKLITSANQTTPGNSVLGTNTDNVADANGNNAIVSNLEMPTSSSHDYYIIVWLNETEDLQALDAGKTFYAKVEFDASNGSGVTGVFGNTKTAIDDTKYTVTFDPNGGTVSTTSKQVTIGQKYGALPTPTREGYTFKGWNGKNKFDSSKLLKASGWTEENGIYSGDVRLLYEKYAPTAGGEYLYTDFKDNTVYFLSFYTKNATTSGGIKFNFSYVNEGVAANNSSVTSNATDFKRYTLKSKNNQTVKGLYLSYNSRQTIWLKDIQLEEGTTATEWEPYYITGNTKVTQAKNHTLTAIWEEN